MNKRWVWVAAVALAAACSDEGDGKDPTQDAGDGDGGDGDGKPAEVPAALSAALEDARQSSRDVCSVIDACFPEGAEADTCSFVADDVPVTLLRAWPVMAADSCWLPLYEKNAQATLAYLNCIEEAAGTFEACMQSCPDDAGITACDDAYVEAEVICVDDFQSRFTDRERATYLDCEDRQAQGN